MRSLIGRFARPEPLPAEPARAPDGRCVYAVGDVHGELALLKDLLARIEADSVSRGLRPLVVFLGDYVDRGPDSRGVLDLLVGLKHGGGPECRFLRGNHEEAMLAFMADPARTLDWLHFGGIETLASYGIVASAGMVDPERCRAVGRQLAERLDPRHRMFLDELEDMVVLGDYAFVHAGVRPGVPLDQQGTEDLLWIREPFLSSRAYHGKVVVHGHTIVDQVEDLGNRLAVDTGAYASGRLSAVALHGRDRRIVQTNPRP